MKDLPSPDQDVPDTLLWRRFCRRLVVIGIGFGLLLWLGPYLAILGLILASWLVTPTYSIALPLPNDSGTLQFYRRHTHLFLAEYDRRIAVHRRSGPALRSDLAPNTGGRTRIAVYWRAAAHDGRGPLLLLRDRLYDSWVDLGRGCLADTMRPSEAIPRALQCPGVMPEPDSHWRLLGRIEGGSDGRPVFRPAPRAPDG